MVNIKDRPGIALIALLFALLISASSGCDSPENHSGQKENSLDQGEEKHAHNENEDAKQGKDHDKSEDGGHGEETVRLSKEELEEFGIQTSLAGPGELNISVTLPGEVSVNADKVAHVVPRVSGVVREVRKNLGDHVKLGEVMAVLESRELAGAKAEYLAAIERLSLAKANYSREERLWRKKVSSEQDYLNAKQELAEIRIALRSAEQKLHALGFTEKYLKQLPEHTDATFTFYEITAPFNGTVIKKHVALGEAVQNDAGLFVVADLSTVWVDLSVYEKDLPFVKEGAKVAITAGHSIPNATGVISYVGPIVGEQTRTAIARAVVSNDKGALRPGLFITGKVTVKNISVPVIAPKTALQTYEGKTVVFIETAEGFEPSPVTVGQSDETNVEIVSGLSSGNKYATKGAFTLKAQFSKGEFEAGHSH